MAAPRRSSYFVQHIKEMGQRKEDIQRGHDLAPLLWKLKKNASIYEEMVRCLVHMAYTDVAEWDDAWQQLKNVIAIRERYGGHLSADKPPPEDYQAAIGLLELQLKEFQTGHRLNFKSAICSSPELFKHFIRQPLGPNEDNRIVKAKAINIPANDYFLWIIAQLADPSEQYACLEGSSELLKELSRLMRNDPKQQGRFTAREIYRTPVWVVSEPKSTKKDTETEAISVLDALATLEERTEQTVLKENLAPRKAKQKTNNPVTGLSSPQPTATTNTHQPLPLPIAPTTLFTIDKRAHRVFASLFRQPSRDGVPGETPRHDFLHTVTSIGFAVQSLDGLAWMFSPTEKMGNLGRSIIFHEPHPASKIPYTMARRMGGRLARAFGWTGESFGRE
ncbi:MAG: hypothetical protein Q9218_002150 [Villophora microphyllina]